MCVLSDRKHGGKEYRLSTLLNGPMKDNLNESFSVFSAHSQGTFTCVKIISIYVGLQGTEIERENLSDNSSYLKREWIVLLRHNALQHQ